MSWYIYIKEKITDENPLAVQNDMKIIEEARSLDLSDTRWNELQKCCMTNVAKDEVHYIETRKYHRQEYLNGVL